MWSSFSERGRRLVFFAQEEAARLGQNVIDIEHIVLGFTDDPESPASRMLANTLGIPLVRIRKEIEKRASRGHDNLGKDMVLSDVAKSVVEDAHRLRTGHKDCSFVGTEHMLLALVQKGEGLGAEVLRELGATPEATLAAFLEAQGLEEPKPEPVL